MPYICNTWCRLGVLEAVGIGDRPLYDVGRGVQGVIGGWGDRGKMGHGAEITAELRDHQRLR